MLQLTGGASVDDYLDWKTKVNELFECCEINDNTWVGLDTVEFTRYASTLWRKLCQNWKEGKANQVSPWAELKGIMHKTFVPVNY